METTFQILIPIIIENETIYVDKDVLTRKSEFFEGMFRSECRETNSLQIKLIDTNVNAFKFVINVAHGSQIPENVWQSTNIFELIEAIIIAGQYRFNDEEKYLSERVAQLFLPFKHCLIEDEVVIWTHYVDIWEIYERSKNFNLFTLSQLCLKYLDENAVDVIEYLSDSANRRHTCVSIHSLVDLFSRDSFGVNEIQIFDLINDIVINKNISDFDETSAKTLINTIRLPLISEFDIYAVVKQSLLFSRLEINKVLNNVCVETHVNERRVCYQIGKMFSIDDFDIEPKSISRNNNYTRIKIVLPMPTTINHIRFKLITEYSDYYYSRVIYSCEFRTIDECWHTLFLTHTPCFGTQDLYFYSMIVDMINIVGKIDGIAITQRFNINSFFYGNTPSQQIIFKQRTEDYLSNSDSVCFLQIPPVRVLKNLTNYVLRDDNDCLSKKQSKYQYIDIPNISGFDTVYYIRLPHLLFANAMQIQIIQESLEFSSNPIENPNVTSNYKIEVCDTFDYNFGSYNWSFVAQKNVLKSGVFNHRFNALNFALIRITGYRMMETTSTKYPLHIRRVKLFKF